MIIHHLLFCVLVLSLFFFITLPPPPVRHKLSSCYLIRRFPCRIPSPCSAITRKLISFPIFVIYVRLAWTSQHSTRYNVGQLQAWNINNLNTLHNLGEPQKTASAREREMLSTTKLGSAAAADDSNARNVNEPRLVVSARREEWKKKWKRSWYFSAFDYALRCGTRF